MKTHILIVTSIVLFCSSFSIAEVFQTINAPGATQTYVSGIDNGNIAGYYADSSNLVHGFFCDGTNWTTRDMPGAKQTEILCIDGTNFAGQYNDFQGGWHNFLFNGTTWTTIDSSNWLPKSMSGNKIIGTVTFALPAKSVIYDITNATVSNFNYQAGGTAASGIDGDNIVGSIVTMDSSGMHDQGFLYDGSTWTLLDMPGADSTMPYVIDGDNIVGAYQVGSNINFFLYDGLTWKTLDNWAKASDMEGDKIVGTYYDSSGSHGFIYTIPEPATILLFTLSGLALRRKH